jgi:hypothetical protein
VVERGASGAPRRRMLRSSASAGRPCRRRRARRRSAAPRRPAPGGGAVWPARCSACRPRRRGPRRRPSRRAARRRAARHGECRSPGAGPDRVQVDAVQERRCAARRTPRPGQLAGPLPQPGQAPVSSSPVCPRRPGAAVRPAQRQELRLAAATARSSVSAGDHQVLGVAEPHGLVSASRRAGEGHSSSSAPASASRPRGCPRASQPGHDPPAAFRRSRRRRGRWPRRSARAARRRPRWPRRRPRDGSCRSAPGDGGSAAGHAASSTPRWVAVSACGVTMATGADSARAGARQQRGQRRGRPIASGAG